MVLAFKSGGQDEIDQRRREVEEAQQREKDRVEAERRERERVELDNRRRIEEEAAAKKKAEEARRLAEQQAREEEERRAAREREEALKRQAAEAEADRPLVLSGLLEEVIGAPLRTPIIRHQAKPCLGTAPFLARPDGDLPEPEPARRVESQRGR